MQPSSSTLLALQLCLVVAVSANPEFKVDFVRRPASVSYNYFYAKFELTMELNITEIRHFDLNYERLVTGINVKTEKAMSSRDFNVLARVYSGGAGGQLVVQCSSWLRCMEMKMQIDYRPAFIQEAVEFEPYGLQGGLPMRYTSVRSAGTPAAARPALEVVFQRHLDNSLSFAQNWETYANGFGDPSGNYWMGLEQLSALTKDRSCKWTVEVTLFNGSVLSATYKDFQVRGADENYRLWFGAKESGSLHINTDLQLHNGSQFSTFDNNGYCSKTYGGNVGWWFNGCHYFLPNAPIISESDLSTKCRWHTGFSEFQDSNNNNHCIKASKLSFRCP